MANRFAADATASLDYLPAMIDTASNRFAENGAPILQLAKPHPLSRHSRRDVTIRIRILATLPTGPPRHGYQAATAQDRTKAALTKRGLSTGYRRRQGEAVDRAVVRHGSACATCLPLLRLARTYLYDNEPTRSGERGATKHRCPLTVGSCGGPAHTAVARRLGEPGRTTSTGRVQAGPRVLRSSCQ
jgi:hypothetical protein